MSTIPDQIKKELAERTLAQRKLVLPLGTLFREYGKPVPSGGGARASTVVVTGVPVGYRYEVDGVSRSRAIISVRVGGEDRLLDVSHDIARSVILLLAEDGGGLGSTFLFTRREGPMGPDSVRVQRVDVGESPRFEGGSRLVE